MTITELIIQISGVIGAIGIITNILKKQLSKDILSMTNSIKDMDYNNCKTPYYLISSTAVSGQGNLSRERLFITAVCAYL